MTAGWRLAVRIDVSNFCTSLCERSCTRNVTLNSPPRDRSGKAFVGEFCDRKLFVSDTEFSKKGLSGSISRRGVLQAAHKWPISRRGLKPATTFAINIQPDHTSAPEC